MPLMKLLQCETPYKATSLLKFLNTLTDLYVSIEVEFKTLFIGKQWIFKPLHRILAT